MQQQHQQHAMPCMQRCTGAHRSVPMRCCAQSHALHDKPELSCIAAADAITHVPPCAAATKQMLLGISDAHIPCIQGTSICLLQHVPLCFVGHCCTIKSSTRYTRIPTAAHDFQPVAEPLNHNILLTCILHLVTCCLMLVNTTNLVQLCHHCVDAPPQMLD